MHDIYKEEILDHYWDPHHTGKLPHPTVSAEESNTLCGDTIRVDLLINEGAIQDVAFTGTGCAISQAAMSMLTDELIGTSLPEARAMTDDDIHGLLKIPISPARTKCAMLGLQALKKALQVI